MNEALPAGRDETREVQEIMAQFDAPAYVRRARQVEGAYDQLLDRCGRQREEWLGMVRTRIGQLAALAPDWEVLLPLLDRDDQLDLLRRLHDELNPRLRVALAPAKSTGALRRAVAALSHSLERFNQRWRDFLAKVDLQPLNALRDGYNRHYLLEKECALRSTRLAREGFRRLEPLTRDDLAGVFPPLPVPRLAGEGR
jgi:hypothetical protein